MSTWSRAVRVASLRAVRTVVQGLAGVGAAVPAVSSITDARTAGIVAFWGAFGVAIMGVTAFLQNLAENMPEE